MQNTAYPVRINIVEKSPKETLDELVYTYNSQYGVMITPTLVMMMQDTHKRITDLIYSFPELGPVLLVQYHFPPFK